MIAADIVTVYHCETNRAQAAQLAASLVGDLEHTFLAVDNRTDNRGFARACNIGAAQGRAPIVCFLNPDVVVRAPFLQMVKDAFDADQRLVITGEKFQQPDHCIKQWQCTGWVCGAAMMVRRSWWDLLGGFDPLFTWSWEETDLIRTTEAMGGVVRPMALPIEHLHDLGADSAADREFKSRQFEVSRARFWQKWPRK